MSVADLRPAPQFSAVQPVDAHPVHIFCRKHGGKHILRLRDHYLVGVRPERFHEDRMSHGEPQSLPLAHRIAGDSFMAPQDNAVGRHKVPFRRLLSETSLDETRVIIVGDKADLLTVRLVGHRQSRPLSDLPDLILRILPVRHHRPGKLFLGEPVQGIGLILRRGLRHSERIPSFRRSQYPRIVAGGDMVRAELPAALQQGFPLHMPVADDAGIRRPAVTVLFDEIPDHMLLELLSEVEDDVGDPQDLRHFTGIIHRLDPGLSAGNGSFRQGVLPDLHGHAEHVIACFLQQVCRDRAVHTA